MTLEVHCRGEGTPAFLIGGGPAFTTWNLEPVQRMLEQRYRACRWDMRGVGDNAGLPIATGEGVLETWLEDMAAILPREPVVLWGQSWGALQALLFAHRHPGRVKGLVLSNPVDPGLASLEHIEAKRYAHALPGAYPALADIGTARERRLALRRKLASYFVDGEKGWRYAQGFGLGDTNAGLNIRVWEEYRARLLGDGDMARLAPLVAGVVYCRGDVLMPENREEYRRLVPQARHVTLDDCGHFPWVERPRAYATVLHSLVGRATANPGTGPP
ncbi:MAG: alpha/beta hydrolase [Gammaproteobacteria bacterium]|nr:alpha/beta hydrolase [Gammaproteobacteria bacterium]